MISLKYTLNYENNYKTTYIKLFMLRADINLWGYSKGEAISFSAVANGSNNLASQGAYEINVLPNILSDFLRKPELKEIYLRSMPPKGGDFRKLDKGLLVRVEDSLKKLGVGAKVIIN
jgi:hypothetical protein